MGLRNALRWKCSCVRVAGPSLAALQEMDDGGVSTAPYTGTMLSFGYMNVGAVILAWIMSCMLIA